MNTLKVSAVTQGPEEEAPVLRQENFTAVSRAPETSAVPGMKQELNKWPGLLLEAKCYLL